MHNVTPTDRDAQSGSPNRVQIPSTTGLEDTASMFIAPLFRCRHCGQLLAVAQATRDVSTPVTPFVALTPVLSSGTGGQKVSFSVQPVANTYFPQKSMPGMKMGAHLGDHKSCRCIQRAIRCEVRMKAPRTLSTFSLTNRGTYHRVSGG